MLGTIVNIIAIILGSLAGILLQKGIPKRLNTTIMHSIGLATILIGLKGALATDQVIFIIICLVLGAVAGESMRIEQKLESIGKWFESMLQHGDGDFAKSFVMATLLFCVGPMAIVGSLESGLTANHQTLFAKSILDGTASIVLASSMGIGVLFASIPVLFYQGLITLCASYLKPMLTPEVIQQTSSVGGMLIVAIGFNILEIKKLRVGNLLPSIFIPFIYYGVTLFL